jgi:hypothetical protein
MTIRVLSLLLLLLAGPAASWGSRDYCASRSCCEHGQCPLGPGGTCAMASADQTVAIVGSAPAPAPPAAAVTLAGADADARTASLQPSSVAATPHPPPLFLLFRSLRN